MDAMCGPLKLSNYALADCRATLGSSIPKKESRAVRSLSVGQQFGGKKKRWQVVPALMDRFPENCQRWQGQQWFSSWNSLLLCHAPLWWMAAVTEWPSHWWHMLEMLLCCCGFVRNFFLFFTSSINCNSNTTWNALASLEWARLNFAGPQVFVGEEVLCVYMYIQGLEMKAERFESWIDFQQETKLKQSLTFKLSIF